MTSRQTSSRFHTTSWTLVRRAESSPEHLEALLAAYWSPAYAYLRRKGHQPADANDLTQGFLTKIIEKRDLIMKADPDRGRFRTYLLSSLNNFVVDTIREETGRNGTRPRCVPDDPKQFEDAEPREQDDPTRAFERQWATTVMAMAVKRLEAECRAAGTERLWQVFEARLIAQDPVPVEHLVKSLGVSDGTKIHSILQSAKRKFSTILRDEVANTVDEPAEVDIELAKIKEFLAA